MNPVSPFGCTVHSWVTELTWKHGNGTAVVGYTLQAFIWGRLMMKSFNSIFWEIWLVSSVENQREDDCFLVSANCVTPSDPDPLFISSTRVDSRVKSRKKHSSGWANVRKPSVVSLSRRSEVLRLYTTWFKSLQFSNPVLKVVSSNAYPGERRFVFWGQCLGFLKELVKAYLMIPMSPLNSPAFFLSVHL
jgi:hypothetical protein